MTEPQHPTAGPGIEGLAERSEILARRTGEQVEQHLQTLNSVVLQLARSVEAYEAIPGAPINESVTYGRSVLDLLQESVRIQR